MLKRQRPGTPPPFSLSDSPSELLPGSASNPLRSHIAASSQPRSKRPRIQPPPLDGALRGWLHSESTGPPSESDGEEDWAEEDTHDAYGSPLPLSMTAGQYKDANLLLHELHVLNQHRLLFAHPPPPNTTPGMQPPKSFSPRVEELSYLPQPSPPQVAHCEPADQSYLIKSAEMGLVEEVQYVRQRYEEVNRLLGSLFLSRRREVAGIYSSVDHSDPRV